MVDRVYRPYWEWEDHEDGMYGIPFDLGGELEAARGLLAAPTRLETAMQIVVDAWPNSAEHHLTNLEENRRAWLGQAACRLSARATALATRAAWGQLTEPEQRRANHCADRVINEWSADRSNVGRLFGVNDG